VGAGTDAAVGFGARLHRDVGGARDRHPPRRIRARGAAAYRGDTINSRRLDRLAEAAPPLGTTVATGGRGNVRVRAFTVKISTSGSSGAAASGADHPTRA